MTTIEKTVNWWAEQITSNQMNWDNGDDSATGRLAFLLGNTVAANARAKITADQIETFKDVLSSKMQRKMGNGQGCNLYCDYSPEGELYDAAKAAGIDRIAFPCKSSTRTTFTKAEAKLGYGNQYEEI